MGGELIVARARNIKPGFYQNEILAECSVWARLMFPGLWMMADREGRLEDRPMRIKASVLPYDNQNVDKLLTELHNRGFIYRYQVGSGKFIQIINFRRHQNPHCKEPASTIPAPPPECQCNGPEPDESGARTGPEPTSNSSGPADSLLPITDSPSLNPGDTGFSRFWEVWPKRVAKAEAVKAWKKLSPDQSLVGRILDDVGRRVASADWRKDGGKFIPNPATYLNGRRWEDEPVVVPPSEDPEASARWEMTRRLAAERAAREASNGEPDF